MKRIKTIKHKSSRLVSATVRKQRIHKGSRYLTPRRFDIPAKTMYARAIAESNESEWPREVYKRHINAFNGFYEREPLKNSFEDFDKAFKSLVGAMVEGDFRHHKSPIIADRKRMLLNGSHRLATAIALDDRRVNVQISLTESPHNWDYRFFSQGERALTEEYLDAMTVEYVSLKKQNIFAVILYPSAKGHRSEAREYLSKLGQIVNVKSIPKSELSGVAVIRQLYLGEPWNKDYDGAKVKADPCFSGDENLEVYILETTLDEEGRRKEKEYLRSIWGISKHSIHITDTIEEVNRVTRMFFHRNSRMLLALDSIGGLSTELESEFEGLLKAMPKDYIERDNICIEGSAVLDLLGIRKARDIDYITRKVDFRYSTELVDNHNGYNNSFPKQLHAASVDELITNPNNYIYYAGVKFLDINQVMMYKLNRGEEKDSVDVKQIKSWLKAHPSFKK